MFPLVPGNVDSLLLVEENIIIRSKIYIETETLWPFECCSFCSVH